MSKRVKTKAKSKAAPKDPYALFDKAGEARERSDFKKALTLYKEALTIAKVERSEKEFIFAALLAVGDTSRLVGDFNQAIKSYKQARATALKLRDFEGASDAHVGLALALRALSRWREAVAIFNSALAGYRRRGDKTATAFTLWARAGAYRVKGDLTRALKDYEEASALFTALKDRSGVGFSLTGLGGTSRVAGDPEASLKYYKKANKKFQDMKDTFGTAYSYCGIANAYRMKEDFDSAEDFFKKATREYKKIGDKVSYAYTLWGEASLFQVTGRWGAARKSLARAEGLFKETGDRRGLIYIEMSRGQDEFVNCGGGPRCKEPKARARLKRALNKARKLELGLESRYIERILIAMDRSPDELPLNLA